MGLLGLGLGLGLVSRILPCRSKIKGASVTEEGKGQGPKPWVGFLDHFFSNKLRSAQGRSAHGRLRSN